MGHENKCAHLHGHNYVVYLTVMMIPKEHPVIGGQPVREDLDGIGRVVDFSIVKQLFGDWIDKHWDHGMVLSMHDLAAIEAVTGFTNERHEKQKVHLLPYNPTAENMARYLLTQVGPQLLPPGLVLVKVKLYETENCFAEAQV
jgi:6-pyruvoyltetrahydropterin/6-carboxytetrahydropterin synthase